MGGAEPAAGPARPAAGLQPVADRAAPAACLTLPAVGLLHDEYWLTIIKENNNRSKVVPTAYCFNKYKLHTTNGYNNVNYSHQIYQQQ